MLDPTVSILCVVLLISNKALKGKYNALRRTDEELEAQRGEVLHARAQSQDPRLARRAPKGPPTPCEEAMSAVAVKLLVRGSPPGRNVQAKVWRSLVQLGPLTDTPDWSTQQKKKG